MPVSSTEVTVPTPAIPNTASPTPTMAIAKPITFTPGSFRSDGCPVADDGPPTGALQRPLRPRPGWRDGSVGRELDQAAHIAAAGQVGVASRNRLQLVVPADQLVELQLTALIEPDQQRDVADRIAGAEKAAEHPALGRGQDRAGDLDVQVKRIVRHASDHHGAAPACCAERVGDYRRGQVA